MIIRSTLLLFALLCLSPAGLATEPYEIQYGDYVVHYNVFPSEVLLPRVAKATGIRRAKSQLVLTLVVKEKQGDQSSQSIQADITGNIINIYGQVRSIKPREINDRGVIYYVQDFPTGNNERLKFSLRVTPEGEDQPLQFEFSH